MLIYMQAQHSSKFAFCASTVTCAGCSIALLQSRNPESTPQRLHLVLAASFAAMSLNLYFCANCSWMKTRLMQISCKMWKPDDEKDEATMSSGNLGCPKKGGSRLDFSHAQGTETD